MHHLTRTVEFRSQRAERAGAPEGGERGVVKDEGADGGAYPLPEVDGGGVQGEGDVLGARGELYDAVLLERVDGEPGDASGDQRRRGAEEYFREHVAPEVQRMVRTVTEPVHARHYPLTWSAS